MNIETERKFLVNGDGFLAEAESSHLMKQGYIAHDGGRTVRVRLVDGKGVLTIKGPTFGGLSRMEWEKELSLGEAEDLLLLCKEGLVEKTRYIIPAGKRRFEVDVFHGENEGLVMAEIELESAEEAFDRPSWLAEEVTGDRRYYNSFLSKHPFKTW